MESIIKVIGAGPGDPEFLTAAGAAALGQAETIFAAGHLLKTFGREDQELIALESDLKAAVRRILERSQDKRVAVLVSGDTGIFSFAATLADHLPPHRLEFIPGISSVQLMFARLKQSYQDVAVISRHGREDPRLTAMVRSGLTVAVLTDSQNSPQTLACELLESGCGDRPVSVGSNLSYDDERIYRGTLTGLRGYPEKLPNSVVVVGV